MKMTTNQVWSHLPINFATTKSTMASETRWTIARGIKTTNKILRANRMRLLVLRLVRRARTINYWASVSYPERLL